MADNYAEIQPGLYWIGSQSQKFGLRHNSYLIADKHSCILIDPPPANNFQPFQEVLSELVADKSLTHIIIQNLSPAVCSTLPLLVKNFNAVFCFHSRAKEWLKAFSIPNEIYFTDENQYKLITNTGRELNFIETPYLSNFESYITYDKNLQTLFSSVLFSANTLKWKLFADKVFYKESMKSFHEINIPGNKFITPIMDMILKIYANNGIKFIASTHGSVINQDFEIFINILKNLECGIAINPIVNDLTRKEGYITLCNQILEELLKHFAKKEILDIFDNSNIELDAVSCKIKNYPKSGEELWDSLFSLIYTKKGPRWLSVIYQQVISLAKLYHVPKPSVFNDKEQALIRIENENIRLKIEIEKLEENLEKTTENITKDKVTKLYNEAFLRDFLRTIIYEETETKNTFILLIIEIDDVWKIKRKFGKQGDEKVLKIIQILGDILKIEAGEKNYQLFKMSSEGAFLFYIQNENIENVIYFSEKVRNDVYNSARFQENISVSCGILSSKEFEEEKINENLLLLLTFTRLGIAKSKGPNQICYTSEIQKVLKKTILIIESESIYIDLLKTAIEPLGYQIVFCDDGFSASKLIERSKPDLVIAELMIPKENGLTVRDRMLQVANYQNIPFILISHLKNEEVVQQAYNLKVNYFLQKPFFVGELVGIIKNILHN